jgi:non-specific serine/threonine protein kinase
LAEQAGDYALADRPFEQAITAEREIDDQPELLRSLTLRGAIAARHGDQRVAATALTEALRVGELNASTLRVAHLLEALANLILQTDLSATVRLASAAAHMRAVSGAAPSPTEQARLGAYLETAKRRLGDRVYTELWSAGHTETLDAILTLAGGLLQTVTAAGLTSRTTLSGVELSSREREVAALVGQGHNNRDIADELVISTKTVQAHIHHILNKLGLSNRVQIATWGDATWHRPHRTRAGKLRRGRACL